VGCDTFEDFSTSEDLEADMAWVSRIVLLRREQILRELTHATEVANLRHRLAQAEVRLRPRLVSEAAD
jgi:hypothetical protein